MQLYADQYGTSTEMSVGLIVLAIVLYVAVIGFMLFAYGKIISRTGYPWPWIFIIFVPIVNIVMLLMLAFKQWPVERELELTRRALEAATGSPFPPGSQLAHYGNYQIGSGHQGYGAGMGYAGPGGEPYSGQLYADSWPGASPSGASPSGADPSGGGQEFGGYNPYAQGPSDNPYQPKG